MSEDILSTPDLMSLDEAIPGFKIRTVLGRGGVGHVYRATDAAGRTVALKVMPLEVDETRKKRFAQEASIGRLLRHPDIVEVYDTGIYENLGWISMELLEGSELAPAMRDRTFQVDDRVRVIARVASALHYAHGLGVIHRDVKPSNVFLTNGGGVKLLDFGIARLKANRITKTGFIVGTPQYMSPEQVTGVNIDGRSDVFALGVVAYELLTGQLPWTGDNHTQLMMAICAKPAIPFESAFDVTRFELTPEALKQLHNVIHRAIRQEPEHRYPDAAAFSRALRAFLDGDEMPADVGVTDVDPDAVGKRRIDWAMARAARVQVEDDAPPKAKPEAPAPMTEPVTHFDEQPAGHSNTLWMTLLAVFTIALGIAVWLMLSTE